MRQKILILKSEILKDNKRLNNLFSKFDEAYNSFLKTKEYSKLVESAFYVNQIFSGFERIFKNIAKSFENEIAQDLWHKALIERMALNIEGIRPNVISEETLKYLDELRVFRHFFRHAYDVDIDKEKFKIIASRTNLLKSSFEKDTKIFFKFLSDLLAEL
ncbi:MAG: ribonuclease toxin HepT-like protein [Candidatus Scalindua sp.]